MTDPAPAGASGAKSRFRTLVEGSVQGIIVHRRMRPLFVNQAYAHMFGFDAPPRCSNCPISGA